MQIKEISKTEYSEYAKWKGWGSDSFGTFTEYENKYFIKEMSRFGKNLNILEIGFGNGNFMYWAKSNNHKVEGVELIESLVQAASKNNYVSYGSLEEVPAEKYDLIVAFDVLEHIPNSEIVNFISMLSDKLKKDGYILARFPNGDSPLSLHLQNGDLTHVNAIGESKMKQICNSSSVKLMEWVSPAYTYHGDIIKMVGFILKRSVRFFIFRLYALIAFSYSSKPVSSNVVCVLKK